MEIEVITTDFSVYFAIPSLITLIFILGLISIKRWRELLWENFLIAGLIFSLFILNLLEVITFSNIYSNFEMLLRAYYIVIIISHSFFFCLSNRLNNPTKTNSKTVFLIFVAINIILIPLLLFSNLFIAGATRTSYTISRIPGEYYWTIQIFFFLCTSISLALILKSIVNATNPLDKKRHKVILFSFVPITVAGLLVIILMQVGFEINFSIILPFSTLLFLIVYLFTENKRDLFKFLVTIPYSNERTAYKELNDKVIEYIARTQTEEKVSLKEAMSAIEKAFISRALEIKDGNHNLAAEMLSISMSTIYRKEERSDESMNK